MIINRYIQKTLLIYIANIALIFLALHVIISLSSEFNAIGKGQYTIRHAIEYVLLTSPSTLYQKFPFIMLISGLLAIHNLHKHHEITVMRASGMSMPMLCFSVCIMGAIMTLASTVLGEVIAPNLEKLAFKIKTTATSDNQLMTTKKGFWLHENNQFFYIKNIQSNHFLSNISRYVIDTKKNIFIVSTAQSAKLSHGQWVFKNIVENEFSANEIEQRRFTEQSWPLSLTSNLIQSHPEQVSLLRLQKVLRERQKSGLALPEQHLQFWQRLFQPALTMVMLLFAIPFAFGSLRQAYSGFKVIFGFILGFVCYFATYFVSTVAVLNHVPAWLSAVLPTLILFAFSVVGIWLQANQTIKLSDILVRIKS
jgi:lipopolysaccharide export system permease protein